MKILVGYTTLSGTTAEVAQAVGEELGKQGAQVDVRLLEEVKDLEAYDAVVLGAPLIVGWHRAATRFYKQHRSVLSRKPLALFIMAMSLTQTGEQQVDGTPVTVDATLAKPPAHEGRLSFKERYATVTNYLRPILKAAPEVKPLNVAFFGGRLDYYRLKWWALLFVMLIIQVQPGERRNWEAIRAWAAGLYPSLCKTS
jgi:menaquinone-dependent protoporphyrinogen oxidase